MRGQLGLPSILLLFLLLVVLVSRRRRPVARGNRGDQRVPARQLVLHAAALHVHDLRGRERPCAHWSSSPSSIIGQRPRRARSATRGRRRACALGGGGACSDWPARSPGARTAREPPARARARGSRRAAPVARAGGESTQRAETASRRAPSPSTKTVVLDAEPRARPRRARRSGAEDQHVLDAFASELDGVASSSSELQAEASRRPRSWPRPTSCARRSSPRSRTTCARRSPPSRRR